MTMSDTVPRRPTLHDLRGSLFNAHTVLRTARDGLRDLAARHADHDPLAALALAQLAAGVDVVAAKVPPKWPQPVTTDMWLVEADRLHELLSTVVRHLSPLKAAADERWTVVPVPEAALVQSGDGNLFGREPRDGDDRWIHPRDVWDLGRLTLVVGSAAWERRAAVVAAADGWARDYQAAVDAAGVRPIQEGVVGLTAVLGEICAAAVETRAKLLPGVRAKACIAARALAEEDDDSDDLPALARDRAAELGPDILDALAWAAVADLLTLEAQR